MLSPFLVWPPALILMRNFCQKIAKDKNIGIFGFFIIIIIILIIMSLMLALMLDDIHSLLPY